ncbi:FtsX-like permease family protein [Actinophytocola xinjiangensis]|nr:FtsX-like permease family protein [Actinophytocola xinjiangensis]
MAGRLLLVWRLMVRDLRRHPVESLLLLVAVIAASGTLTVGLSLGDVADQPYQQTRRATAGPDAVARPRATGEEALAALAPLTTAPGVADHSGPFPVAFLDLTAGGRTAHAVVEGRDTAPARLDRPAVVDGGWVRPGGVVVERAFADALGVGPGDTVSVAGHPLRVAGTAVTAARVAYPYAGWHFPGSELAQRGGLVWVDRGDLAALAGAEPLSYTLNLRVTGTLDGVLDGAPGLTVLTSARIAEADARTVAQAREALLVGSWLLTALAMAGVAGIVAGRVAGRRRQVGLLKAVGAGPAAVAVVHLAGYLVIGLAGAAAGLLAGLAAGPALIQPSAGLLDVVDPAAPSTRTVLAVTALAVAIAVAAALVPVVRAATTSTVHALADTATPPRRSRWRIGLSRLLPVSLLIGVRVNARRPRRARLVVLNTLITTTALVAVLMNNAREDHFDVGGADLVDPRAQRVDQAMLVITVVLCVLALVNAVVTTWTAVLDAGRPLALTRALGATPGQAGLGLAMAQLLPALPGAVAGIPAGLGLFLVASRGEVQYPSGVLLSAVALGVPLAGAALTAVPAIVLARRPVADTLRSG